MPSHDRLREKIVSQKTPRIALLYKKHAKRLKLSTCTVKKPARANEIWCQILKLTSSEGEKTFSDA